MHIRRQQQRTRIRNGFWALNIYIERASVFLRTTTYAGFEPPNIHTTSTPPPIDAKWFLGGGGGRRDSKQGGQLPKVRYIRSNLSKDNWPQPPGTYIKWCRLGTQVGGLFIKIYKAPKLGFPKTFQKNCPDVHVLLRTQCSTEHRGQKQALHA